MQWVRAAEYPADTDLSRIDKKLHSEKIPHRFTMEAEGQVLWLADSGDADEVVAQVGAWLRNPESLIEEVNHPSNQSQKSFRFTTKPAPITLTLLALSMVGATLYGFSIKYGTGFDFISPFTFWNPELIARGDSEFKDIAAGQYWRLITPIFIHFSLIHIVFNGMWLWYLGTMVERGSGPFRLLLLVFLVGLVSNVAQVLVSPGYAVLGGMSGVNFGLLSYLWLAQRLGGPISYRLPDPMFFFMSGYMLLSAFGIFDWMAGGDIADTAHIVGYITGIISALAIYLFNNTAKGNEI